MPAGGPTGVPDGGVEDGGPAGVFTGGVEEGGPAGVFTGGVEDGFPAGVAPLEELSDPEEPELVEVSPFAPDLLFELLPGVTLWQKAVMLS